MKKKVVIILCIVVLVSFGGIIFFKKPKFQEYRASSDNGIKTVLSLDDEIQDDTIWCGTFQLIWNDLKNDLAKQDIVFNPQLDVVSNLNNETFKTKDISEDYYYKKVGNPTLALKNEIEKEIKKKFNEKSDILDQFKWSDEEVSNSYFLYAMLKKEFKFEKAFEELDNGKFGKYNNVKYFGIENDETDELKNQVVVLYYNSENDFAIKLKTKQEDEVILCKNPNGKSFNEVYKNILKEQKNYKGSKSLDDKEKVKVPNISLNEMNSFEEIKRKPFKFSNGKEVVIDEAIQTIEFELDRTGGKVKSEAGMSMLETAYYTPEDQIRKFFLDDTFAIFLVEEGKENPYFAAKISDISKFQSNIDKNDVNDDVEPVINNEIPVNQESVNNEPLNEVVLNEEFFDDEPLNNEYLNVKPQKVENQIDDEEKVDKVAPSIYHTPGSKKVAVTDDGGIASVKYYINGTWYELQVEGNPKSFIFNLEDIKDENENNTIVIVAVDMYGNEKKLEKDL